MKVVVLHQERLQEIIQELYGSGNRIYALAIEHLIDELQDRPPDDGLTFDIKK